jgi:hypothetical protein
VTEQASLALRPWPLAVGALMLAALVARVLLSRDVLAPWAMLDELQYAEAARSFLSGGHYLFRDEPRPLRTIYPILISPAWLAGSVQTSYMIVKVINSVLMVLGAIPLYLWSRRLVAPLWGVLVVALYLAMPGFIYTSEILTENAYVPATVLALYATAVAIERQSLPMQALALGAIGLAACARIQGLILLAVLFTAIGIAVVLDAVGADPGARRRAISSRLRRFWPLLCAPLLVALAYVVYERGRGQRLWSGLGAYENIAHVHYGPVSAAKWVLWHFGELSLSVGILPVSALIVLLGLALRRETAPSAAERAFLAVTTAAVFWIVVQTGTFASHFSLRIEERLMFNVTPALFLALAVWLARGLPRPPALSSVAVLAPVAALLVLPYSMLLAPAVFNDTFGLIPVWRLLTRLGDLGETRLVVAAGALILSVLFVAVPRRIAVVAVPASLMAFLVLSTNSVFGTIEFISAAARHAGGLNGDPSWVDHAIGKNKRVEILNSSDLADAHVAWQAEFWNRSVQRTFAVSAQDPSIPDVSASIDGRGRIVPVLPASSPDRRPRYVLAARSLDVDGTQVGSSGQLVLWRVRRPLRLAGLAGGLTPDGYTGPTATYKRYVIPPGATHVDVIVTRPGFWPLPPARAQAIVGPIRDADGAQEIRRIWSSGSVRIRAGERRVLRLPIRKEPFEVRLSVTPTFSPSQFSSSTDTRRLGARARFVVR